MSKEVLKMVVSKYVEITIDRGIIECNYSDLLDSMDKAIIDMNKMSFREALVEATAQSIITTSEILFNLKRAAKGD